MGDSRLQVKNNLHCKHIKVLESFIKRSKKDKDRPITRTDMKRYNIMFKYLHKKISETTC